MKRSRFSEEQVIGIFAGAGGRQSHGGCVPQAWVSSATFYKWKAKFGGLDVSDARRLKALEDENAKLKKLLAETMLERAKRPMVGDVGRAKFEAR